MPFEPDVIVSDPEGFRVSLVVEAKSRIVDLAAVEAQLKRYMVGNRCPVGMLVTPETIRIYRDTYRGEEEGSVERVGELPATGIFGTDVATTVQARSRLRLDDAVQSWLETLRSPSALSNLPPPLREALEEHVMPVLFEGEIRAARPRFRTAGS